MTNERYPLTELSDAVAPARERHRELIDAAVAWPTGRARPTDPDVIALICAVVDKGLSEISPTRWSRTGVARLTTCDIPHWCSTHRTLWPETICETLWDWLGFLHGTGRLDPGSDPVAELRKPLACHGWLDQDGRPLPRDAERPIACECFLPYRETAELLGEILRRCDRTGEEPLGVLRRAAGHEPVPLWSPLGGDGADLFGELGSDSWAAWPDAAAWPDD